MNDNLNVLVEGVKKKQVKFKSNQIVIEDVANVMNEPEVLQEVKPDLQQEVELLIE